MPVPCIIPPSVRGVVVALCADYPRRAEAIEKHTVSPRTENEFKYYNYKILDAAQGIVGAKEAEDFIGYIGDKTGYWSSETEMLSESTFNYRKRLVLHSIAESLHLI